MGFNTNVAVADIGRFKLTKITDPLQALKIGKDFILQLYDD